MQGNNLKSHREGFEAGGRESEDKGETAGGKVEDSEGMKSAWPKGRGLVRGSNCVARSQLTVALANACPGQQNFGLNIRL